MPANLKAFFRIRNFVYEALKTVPNHRGGVVGVVGCRPRCCPHYKYMKQAISALNKRLQGAAKQQLRTVQQNVRDLEGKENGPITRPVHSGKHTTFWCCGKKDLSLRSFFKKGTGQISQKTVMISTRERGLGGAVARWQVGVIRRRVTVLRQ